LGEVIQNGSNDEENNALKKKWVPEPRNCITYETSVLTEALSVVVDFYFC
jgi:hypothetical protein